MPTYAIGDIQGCYEPLQRLLQALAFDSTRDSLWLVGDLVNRGPQSLEVLRFVRSLGDRAQVVLGNHDLHLLARAAGVANPKAKDTLDDVLAASDRDQLLDWLASRPLLAATDKHVLVHAGLHPSWTVELAASLANEVAQHLAGSWKTNIADVIGQPQRWSQSLRGADRFRTIAGYLVRVRACFADGRINGDFDGPLAELPSGCTPWFGFASAPWRTHKIITGHWAALGVHQTRDSVALDSGCVWGRQLTAYCLETGQLTAVEAVAPSRTH